MRGKKGFLGTEIADFIAIVVFALFILVMFFLFKLRSDAANIQISASSVSSESAMHMRNIINTPVEYHGNDYTIGEMISYIYSAPLDNPSIGLKKAIASNVSSIFEKADIINAKLLINGKSAGATLIRRGYSDFLGVQETLSNYKWTTCEPENVSMILPRFGNNGHIVVEYQECVK